MTLFKIKIEVVTLSKDRALIFWISGVLFFEELRALFRHVFRFEGHFFKILRNFFAEIFSAFWSGPQIILAGTFQKIVVTTFKILLLLFRQPLFFIFVGALFSTFRSPTYKNQDQKTQDQAQSFFRSRFGFLIFCV